MTATVTIQQFIKDQRITMTAERCDSNPNMPDSANMDHWKVVLHRTAGNHRYSLTTYFSMGYGHNGKEPKVADVLDCLASDASSIEYARDFEEWCSELGYDSDSRKAEKIYKACEHGAKRLQRFLDGHLDMLLSAERL